VIRSAIKKEKCDQERIVPTDGNGLPINRSGDFGVSPLYGNSQASNVFANVTLYSAFGPVSPGRMSLLGHQCRFGDVGSQSANPNN